MNKIIKIFFIVFLISGCGYQPTLLKKNIYLKFDKIESEGDAKINIIVKNYLLERSNNDNINKFELYISSMKDKKIVSSNKKGDPTIYKLNITVDYILQKNGEIILNNKILKKATYNNINDKFELMKYEENIVKNLSESVANDILTSATVLEK
tara:strand:- start:179 stop:637 length:459 start_codon:yes stop_codon:yes gene_type:complete